MEPPRNLVKLIVLGPPGAGKGTQAARLAKEFSIPRIATGDILRQEVAAGTDLGKHASEYMEKGVLVPDGLVIEMIAERLSREAAASGFILDGFPRNLEQAEALEALSDIDAVVYLDVGEEVVVERFSGRRSCSQCQAVYHVRNSPPRVRGMCDRCGGDVLQRVDDREDVIKQRFRTYREKTEPLVERYRRTSHLVEIDGSGTIAEIRKAIRSALASRGLL